MQEIQFKAIGIIHSPFKEPKGTPIQAAVVSGDSRGTVEVFEKYAEGLKDLDGFSHITLIYYFDRAKQPPDLIQKPFLEEKDHGVFAVRSPSRPNPIGISTVKLIKVEGKKLWVDNLDIIDKTPLLDIKPYVPHFDERKNARFGWVEQHVHKTGETKDDGRFEKDNG